MLTFLYPLVGWLVLHLVCVQKCVEWTANIVFERVLWNLRLVHLNNIKCRCSVLIFAVTEFTNSWVRCSRTCLLWGYLVIFIDSSCYTAVQVRIFSYLCKRSSLLPVYMSVCPSVCPSINPSIHHFVSLFQQGTCVFHLTSSLTHEIHK